VLAAAGSGAVVGVEALAAGVLGGVLGGGAAGTEEAGGAADDVAVPGAGTPLWEMLPHAVTARPRSVLTARR
jgi:hypothetical protein